jgi:hypothetical protein
MSKNFTKVWKVIGLFSSCLAFAQVGNVGINTPNPGSTIDINGSVAANYSAVNTTPYSLTSTNFHVSYNGTSDAIFNLPAAINGVGNFKGRMYIIKNNTNFTITVNSATPETINGNTSILVPANQSVQLINSGLSGANSTWETLSYGTTINNNITASNGTTLSGTDVKLGGTLSQPTNIDTAGNILSVNGTGKILVGTNVLPAGASNSKLVIDNGTANGALQIKDGTQQLGYVLTSDANGLATWSSTTTTAFANNWTPYSGTLVNPFTGNQGGGLPTGISVTIPAKGWYFFRCGITIQSNCNDFGFYINGIGDIWRTYCNVADVQMLSPRDQNRVLYFSTPGTYSILALKTNAVVPVAFNMGNPAFYLDFVKFQN